MRRMFWDSYLEALVYQRQQLLKKKKKTIEKEKGNIWGYSESLKCTGHL